MYDPGGEETGFGVRWTQEEIRVKKFIDDVSGCEKLSMNIEFNSKIVASREIRYCHAAQVAGCAKDRGMLLNERKPTLLCMSAAKSYIPECYIVTSTNERITSEATTLKVLGFTFGLSLIHI